MQIKKYTIIILFSTIAISAILTALINLSWGLGFLIGFIWMWGNFTLTIKIFGKAMPKGEKINILIYFLIKFPLLYAFLLLILLCKKFSVLGILAGMTVSLIIITVIKYAGITDRNT